MTPHLQSQGNVRAQKRKAQSQGECGGVGVGTSSGISLGNLWIISAVLMKVVRINGDIQRVQRGCEETRRGSEMPPFHRLVLETGLLLPAASTSVVGCYSNAATSWTGG